jgi:hypothetical protein
MSDQLENTTAEHDLLLREAADAEAHGQDMRASLLRREAQHLASDTAERHQQQQHRDRRADLEAITSDLRAQLQVIWKRFPTAQSIAELAAVSREAAPLARLLARVEARIHALHTATGE